jgi:uncharacterized protein YfaS (alpha-2-macroglobulin family)
MTRVSLVRAACVLALTAGLAAGLAAAENRSRRESAAKAMQAGNFKDAYESYRRLALDPADDVKQVGNDLNQAVACLQQLGRSDELDDFREQVIAVHKKNWRLLEAAAANYTNGEHYGFLVAGKFSRGFRRGGGNYIATFARDRVRALQLMQEALGQTAAETDKAALARFHLQFAQLLLNGSGMHEPWRLLYLTDLTKLPDFEEGNHWRYGYGYGGMAAAPVDADGNPVYYRLPKSYETAVNDGERWRWHLAQASEFDPALVNDVDMTLAHFLWAQFDVQTMADYGLMPRGDDAVDKKEGTFTVHTLGDDEAIARLATGIKRFKLPDEFNWIKICERVAARGRSSQGEQARFMVARIYEDRRQYAKAAAAWKKAIEEYGPGGNNYRQAQLDQIVGNWGRFEPGQTQPAGTKASVDFRFRNGNKVSFEARAVKVALLLDDVKAYLKEHTGQLDWQATQIGDIGHRLVERGENRYLGEKVAAWDVELTPRPNHVDDRITVTTPMQKPGAYLLTAKMEGGNVSRIIVWLSDTVVLKKPLENKVYCFVGDAVNGKPVPGATVEGFGWKQVQTVPNRNEWKVVTTSFTAKTDDDGQLLLGMDRMPQDYQWLITARTRGEKGEEGRFAYLGFTGVWYGFRYDGEYNATKAFAITDRPVYRPGQTVQFKYWVRHAKYDQADTSSFANQTFTLRITDPKGEKVFEKAYTADEYGGLAGEFPLAPGCTLGSYGIQLLGTGGGTSFRVEEYKKPEFEVTVDAPSEPVSLGDRVGATIKAKYYFGAPVTKAKVKYKVLRSSHSDTWYPRGVWDWFYGKGYWWFAADYAWYPGWSEWGCRRPIPIWWGQTHEQPEVVLENEVDIGADGTVKVVLDTLPAKELHGNQDHSYAITAEVVDESRRTIVGTGNVLVARKPFKVFAWLDRGYYHAGDAVNANFHAQTLDGKPVEGKGELTLYKISYNDKNEPVEKAVESWKVDTDARGAARQQLKAAEPGQFRLSLKVTDAKQHTIEGGYVFVVRGEGFEGKEYRFNDLELTTDKREYAPGEKVRLQVSANRADAAVLLFARPTNGVYLPPKVVRLHGKSTVEEIAVAQKDMPNFFVEAVTVAGGRVFTEVREVIVPPEKRVVNVEVLPSQSEYKPGQKATMKLKLTDLFGKPFVGSMVVSIYDKSVEYISGGSNVPEIKEFFWKWRRSHHPYNESNLGQWLNNLVKSGEVPMSDLGVFGASVVEEAQGVYRKSEGRRGAGNAREMDAVCMPDAPRSAPQALGGMAPAAPAPVAKSLAAGGKDGLVGGERAERDKESNGPASGPPPAMPELTVRKNFADTAFWAASLTPGPDGVAEVSLTMPENLTGWKVKAWAMGHGTKVGQGEAEVTTKKDLLVRLQAPRFFVEKDEVVLSANVHNYLKSAKAVRTTLELEGGTLVALGEPVQNVQVDANGERRVDWRVRVKGEGEAVVRVKAVTDEESDAMELRFPCYVHGMLKTDSFAGALRPEDETGKVTFNVPAERRINESRLEVHYSPTLAGAMVDALPYLVEYPYGCTEQTLNRFVPTVITQRILQDMKLDLKTIKEKRTNLNAQEIGNPRERAKGWQRFPRNPVFDEAEVRAMSAAGVQALVGMQCSDGGWGWFSGYGEHSWPHTTAVVVHGLQLARHNGVALPPGVLERGVAWLKNYRGGQLALLRNAPSRTKPYKEVADNLDALVQMVLADAGERDEAMRDFLYRDRTHLAVYGKCMLGLTLDPKKDAEQLAMVLKNVGQFVVQDDENQTAYLRLPADNAWWYWYGSEIESQAYYLKLLARHAPQSPTASRLVKYLLNNRKHATYWTSTRDTAVSIEAMAEYLKASGENRPDMTVEVWLDGKKHKEVKIDASNVFTFDDSFLLIGDAIESGKHVLEIRKHGTGPVYFNAYLTNFTLEDFITRAGLEVKVDRKYYKLKKVDHTIKVQGARGQAADQKVEKYERSELANLATLKSGDLVEVELTIDSKNDYEYLIFEDPKAAGFEPELVRSGYTPNDLGAYMELRDDRVCFFVRALPRGQRSISYRLRAEVPGKFSALPARASAMYAPELKGNSDEIKLTITD